MIKKIFLGLILAALVITGVVAARKNAQPKPVRWDMINVNQTIQGDAHLIRGPLGTVLIDAGHPREYDISLLPFLIKESVKHIDAIVMTHPHIDHYGGLIKLIANKNISVGKIYLTEPSEELAKKEFGWGVDPAHLSEIKNNARLRNIPVTPVQNFQSFDFGSGYKLTKLHSPTEETLKVLKLNADINDLSLIAMLTNGKVKALLTGDLNTPYSNHLAENNPPDLFQADILKFPHHGMEGFATDAFIKNTKAKHFMTPMPKGYLQNPRADRFFKLAREMGAATHINGTQGHISVLFTEDSFTIQYQRP